MNGDENGGLPKRGNWDKKEKGVLMGTLQLYFSCPSNSEKYNRCLIVVSFRFVPAMWFLSLPSVLCLA